MDVRVAEGRTGSLEANTAQPLYLASVGKLFTATVVSILHDRGDLHPLSSARSTMCPMCRRDCGGCCPMW